MRSMRPTQPAATLRGLAAVFHPAIPIDRTATVVD
jgi:hypothetical protein